jgi:CBS domain-containing protein
MRARGLARAYPVVGLATPAVDAARLLARQNLRGLIVVDRDGRPLTILPGTQVLRMAVPAYCVEDPTLARVVDEPEADRFVEALGGRTVADCLPDERRELPIVDPEATVLEIAALMARTRSPLVAVVDDTGFIGAITLDGLMDRVVGP